MNNLIKSNEIKKDKQIFFISNYNLGENIPKQINYSYDNSPYCSLFGCKTYSDSSLYSNIKKILTNNIIKKNYKKLNIVYYGDSLLPYTNDGTDICIYFSSDDKRLNKKVLLEYLDNEEVALSMQINKLCKTYKIDYLIVFKCSILYILDNCNKFLIRNKGDLFTIISNDNLEYFESGDFESGDFEFIPFVQNELKNFYII